MKLTNLKPLIATVAILGTLALTLACGSRTVVVEDSTKRIEAASSIYYDLSEYEACEYIIQSQKDDIEVNGTRNNTHEGSTRANRLTISNDYSLFTSKTVDVWIKCET